MPDESPYLVKVGELQTDAAKLLFYSLPEEGWDTAELVFREASTYGEFVGECVHSNGDKEPIAPSSALMKAMMELRDQMSKLERGAWFEATLKVERQPSRYSFDYNYDDRPQWKVPPTDETYIEDLEKYPRPADQIPEWHPAKNFTGNGGS